MGAVVVPSRLNTPRAHSSTSDPTTSSDTNAGFRVGDIWVNTATGNIWKAYDVTAGAAKWRHEPRVLGSSGVQASYTGGTDETALATITVPANAMGTNGLLRATALWSNNNSGNAKVAAFRLGGIAGTVLQTQSVTTTVAIRLQASVQNRNAANSQIFNASTTNFGITGTAVGTGAIDTSAATTLVITGDLANGADTISLESYLVELLRPDIT